MVVEIEKSIPIRHLFFRPLSVVLPLRSSPVCGVMAQPTATAQFVIFVSMHRLRMCRLWSAAHSVQFHLAPLPMMSEMATQSCRGGRRLRLRRLSFIRPQVFTRHFLAVGHIWRSTRCLNSLIFIGVAWTEGQSTVRTLRENPQRRK